MHGRARVMPVMAGMADHPEFIVLHPRAVHTVGEAEAIREAVPARVEEVAVHQALRPEAIPAAVVAAVDMRFPARNTAGFAVRCSHFRFPV